MFSRMRLDPQEPHGLGLDDPGWQGPAVLHGTEGGDGLRQVDELVDGDVELKVLLDELHEGAVLGWRLLDQALVALEMDAVLARGLPFGQILHDQAEHLPEASGENGVLHVPGLLPGDVEVELLEGLVLVELRAHLEAVDGEVGVLGQQGLAVGLLVVDVLA